MIANYLIVIVNAQRLGSVNVPIVNPAAEFCRLGRRRAAVNDGDENGGDDGSAIPAVGTITRSARRQRGTILITVMTSRRWNTERAGQ